MLHFIYGFVIIIIVGVSPWLAINLVGHYLVKGLYKPLDFPRQAATGTLAGLTFLLLLHGLLV
ncbi:hypothetical protein ACE198_10445 [Neobacillus sp. KR4-4]|uniref:hypothetical protein n=1 Tax=Neobacillus sp. KR4-4 TaxID=3344872 RepID=UPI0035CBEB1E